MTSSDFEPEFTRLLSEWRSIDDVARSSITEWTAAVEAIAREEHALRQRGAWMHGRDDLFGVLGIQRAEIRHSAAIAWLLDPCARHGLGPRFLEAFLRRAWRSEEFRDLAAARVACEVTRGDCRADIVIWMNAATIVIESKVDANESVRQCDILFERFGENPGARFIFLTPSGRRPESASGDAAEAFAAMSFSQLRDALAEALATHAAMGASGRHIAEDYLRTLRREFR